MKFAVSFFFRCSGATPQKAELKGEVRANGSREPAHLVSESADGTLLIKLLSSGKGKRAPPSRVLRNDAKRGAGDDSDGNCSDASEVALVRVEYMPSDGRLEPAENRQDLSGRSSSRASIVVRQGEARGHRGSVGS